MSEYARGYRSVIKLAFGPSMFLARPWDNVAGTVGLGDQYDTMQTKRDRMVARAMDYQQNRAAFERWWSKKDRAGAGEAAEEAPKPVQERGGPRVRAPR